MQSKFEFNKLFKDLQIEIAKKLSNPDLTKLAQASKSDASLFKPMIDVNKLLHHVTHGEHGVVKAMLKKDISLVFKRGVVTDCSGRKFENVSAFEYALWALDYHTWNAMLKLIPSNDKIKPSNEEGKKVFAQMLAQYNKLNTIGITYTLNGKTSTEKHFDFVNTILKELQTQADSIEAPGLRNWEAIDKQWREGVGSAQKLLPMHVVDEYCSDKRFYPVPNFSSYRAKSSKQFFNKITNKYFENWFSVDSKLGIDFAIYKLNLQHPVAGASWRVQDSVDSVGKGYADDLRALQALYKERIKDFINLKWNLDNMIIDKWEWTLEQDRNRERSFP